MGAMASTDVTVTLAQQDRDMFGFAHKVSFPTLALVSGGSKTYPANGIPLPAIGAFGMNKAIKFFQFMGSPGNGYVYKYDKVRHTLRIYVTGASGTLTFDALAAHTHDIKLIGGITATEPVAVAGGDTLGKNAATDRTIAGADVATKGGVVAASAGTPSATGTLADGPLAELATGAVVTAVTDLIAMVIGN